MASGTCALNAHFVTITFCNVRPTCGSMSIGRGDSFRVLECRGKSRFNQDCW